MILAASLDADIAAAQADVEAAENWCNTYGCYEPEAPPVSGPNAGEYEPQPKNCGAEVTFGLLSLAGAALARYSLYSLGASIAGGAAVATGMVAATAFGAIFAVAGAVYAGYTAYQCVYGAEPASESMPLSELRLALICARGV